MAQSPRTLRTLSKDLKPKAAVNALLNTPIQTILIGLLYIALLVAIFIIGYLLGRMHEGSTTTPTAVAPIADPNAQAQAPVAPNPEDAIKLLGKARLPIKGNADAKVKIVEFSDFECPFCGQFYKDSMSQLISDYVDTGKVSIEYRHYPLPFHPQAKPLAIASECANEQGMFWEMHDLIFQKNVDGTMASATADTYKQWAAGLGLNTTEFNACLDEQRHADIVDSDTTLGSSLGVTGTPTFYINGVQLVGALPYATIKATIDQELAK